METPLVSVIITTYRNEIYLPRAIDSVLRQSYQPIELIVVDDNPPDSDARRATEAVMAHYPQAIYLRHPENRNGSAARNTGIRAATGRYIAFLDNDDFYFTDHIASCVRALREHPDCGAVVCGVVKIRGGICWEQIAPPQGDLPKELLFRETALGTGSNLFVTADTVRAIGGFDERFRRHQDLEFGIRYFARDKAWALEEVQIVKEMDGFSNMPDLPRFLQTKELFWDTFRDRLSQLTEDERHRYFAGQYSALLYSACKAGDAPMIAQLRQKLTEHRPLDRKERILVALSRMGLFGAYETLKTRIKATRSRRLRDRICSTLSEQDTQVFLDALDHGKKG